MPDEKVTLVHKDLPDEPITVSAHAVDVWKQSGWKLAPKTQQPDEAKS